MTRVIGLTGGIGGGKSTAAEILRGLGAYIIDADIISRELCLPKKRGAVALRQEFGADFFDGEILSRRRLREFVFANERNTQRLNSVMLPLITDELTAQLRSAAANGEKFIVAVVPLLFETDMQKMFDETWLVTASEAERIKRVAARDNISENAARLIIAAQMPEEQKARLADKVILNDGTSRDLAGKIKRLLG